MFISFHRCHICLILNFPRFSYILFRCLQFFNSQISKWSWFACCSYFYICFQFSIFQYYHEIHSFHTASFFQFSNFKYYKFFSLFLKRHYIIPSVDIALFDYVLVIAYSISSSVISPGFLLKLYFSFFASNSSFQYFIYSLLISFEFFIY